MTIDVITIEAHDTDGKPIGCIKMSVDDINSLKERHNKDGILVMYDMLMTSIARINPDKKVVDTKS